jgi:hypothetical protein
MRGKAKTSKQNEERRKLEAAFLAGIRGEDLPESATEVERLEHLLGSSQQQIDSRG